MKPLRHLGGWIFVLLAGETAAETSRKPGASPPRAAPLPEPNCKPPSARKRGPLEEMWGAQCQLCVPILALRVQPAQGRGRAGGKSSSPEEPAGQRRRQLGVGGAVLCGLNSTWNRCIRQPSMAPTPERKPHKQGTYQIDQVTEVFLDGCGGRRLSSPRHSPAADHCQKTNRSV